jgi:hypothetical protein
MALNKSREKISRLEIWLERFSAGESQLIDQIFFLSQKIIYEGLSKFFNILSV